MKKNLDLFGNPVEDNKTYRAIRHDVVRNKQNDNSDFLHHPNHKTKQIRKILKTSLGFFEENHNIIKILELFSGRGNLTKVYEDYGQVDAYDKKWLKTGDSYRVFHGLIYEKNKYQIVDLDPYGFPIRFFPDIFLLIDNGVLFVTMPKPYVNILNGITATHLASYFGEKNPSKEKIINRIALWGLCHWRKVELLSCIDCKSIWRFAFNVEKVKATDYTGVKNR